ncbi:hypothetical protein, partial [Salmonella sp. SAL4434]|uniref:hypothetical protein n=1 Tax=Salmonella sp. SAL4434 TaxID=3159889 RepID=UPI00397C3387
FPAPQAPADDHDDHAHADTGPPAAVKVELTEAAVKNLGLATAPLRPGTFWKTVTLPGMIIDRPGVTDRGVAAPATGVVTR